MRKIAMLLLAFALLTTAITGCRAMESESSGTSSGTNTTASTAASSTSTAPSTSSSAQDSTEPSSSITPRGPRMPHF